MRNVRRIPACRAAHNSRSATLTALDEVLALMRDIAGYAIEVRVNPAFVRGQEVARLRGSNAHLRAVLGDAPGGIPLRETLRWMFAAS